MRTSSLARSLVLLAAVALPAACAAPDPMLDDTAWASDGERGMLRFVLESSEAPIEGPNQLDLTVEGDVPADVEVSVRAHMTAMGHGEATVSIEPVEPTRYDVEATFPMPGDWMLEVSVWRGAELLDRAELEFPVR